MKDNKEFIEGIYKKYDEYLNEKNKTEIKDEPKKSKFSIVGKVKSNNFFNKNNKSRIFTRTLSTAAAAIIIVSGIFMTQNVLKDGDSFFLAKTDTTSEIPLNKVESFENFYNIINESCKNNPYLKGREDIVYESDTSAITNKAGSIESNSLNDSQQRTSSDDYSKTNIQVENVDESDIVKTNGKYIFYVLTSKVVIVDIQDKSKMKQVAEISYLDGDFNPSQLYIYKDKLVVIGNEKSYSSSKDIVKETFNKVFKKGIYKQMAVAIIYDISNIENPKEIRNVKIEGNYMSSRMIDGNIYFVTNKSINAYNVYDKDIKELDENQFKPSYVDTAVSTQEKMIDYNRIYYFDNIEQINYLTLGGFSLNNNDEVDIETFLGAGENIYCSEKNMYVIKSKNVYDADTRMSFGKDTKIIKFALNNGQIDYKAEATIDGGINNQFSIDEKDGNLRIATTIGKTYNMDNSTSNTLYILDEKLQEIGKLEKIAKGEKIYSVRYVGNKAYVVTFKEIDPLFVIDLSNPRNPTILGELKIPGYSTYLHPYDENHIIGFGYDTKPNSSNTGVIRDGLKMSMFDITDYSNPKEMFSIKIGDNRTNSILASDHKALLFSKEKNIIAFPITSSSITSKSVGGTKYGAQIYDIDLEKGFKLRGEILHTQEDNDLSKFSNYKLIIDRIVYSNNVFYTLSKALIKSSDMDSLEKIDVLNFK